MSLAQRTRGPRLAHYRIYQLDGAGHITRATDRECAGDEEARAAARVALRVGTRGEVWQGARRVGYVSASPARSRPPVPWDADLLVSA